jgi:hypothetical protein
VASYDFSTSKGRLIYAPLHPRGTPARSEEKNLIDAFRRGGFDPSYESGTLPIIWAVRRMAVVPWRVSANIPKP